MKLSKKLVISFIIIAIFPIMTMFGAVMILGRCQIDSIEEKYGIEISTYEMLYNPVGMLNQITDNVKEQLHEINEKNPQNLENTDYLKKFNSSLLSKYTFIAATKDDEIVFNGNTDEYKTLSDILSAESIEIQNINETLYVSGKYQYLIKQEPISYSDGKEGNIYIISKINNSLPEVRKLVLDSFIFMAIVTVITGVLLTIWIYNGILKPVTELKKEADNIANGNLDFEVVQYKENEFGELSRAFEEMRKHLKASIEENIHNDEENKELISNISHDLKTPITAIKGYVEGIMDGVADSPEKMDKYIRTIYNKANDMDKLIGELTIYSRIDNNKIPYNFVKLNLEEYFNDCVDEINTDLDARGIKLTYINYVDKEVLVIADPEQLKRVINNIISNSVKYMDKKEKFIAIRIVDEDDFVRVEMEDNGKGIGNEELPYIFDRFYRTDSSRNSSQGGSGIGLAITKKIIEAHGGRIWATSKLGSGTTIHFILRKIV